MHRPANGYSSKRDGTVRRLSCLAGIVLQADGSYRCDCPRLCGAAHKGNVTVKVRADAAIAAVCEKCGNERLSTWLELETRVMAGLTDEEKRKVTTALRTETERLLKAAKWLRRLAEISDESIAAHQSLIRELDAVELKQETP